VSIRSHYDDIALSKICSYAGKSRQSYYQGLNVRQARAIQCAIIVDLVKNERRIAKRISAKKLYIILKKELENHNIKIGRDKFYDVLRDNGLLVYRKKRRPTTTDSNHELPLYPNRAKNYEIDRSEQLGVSDITYDWVGEKWCYLMLITDSYSRKVVGWNFGKNMTAEFCHEGLDKAIKGRKYTDRKLMHHSDRGSQYCSKLYTKELIKNEIKISMTENGDPLENPLAERMNRTFKYEFAMDEGYSNFEKAQVEIAKAIKYYNSRLPHSSVDMLTPDEAHEKQGPLKKHWRWYWREAQENLEQNFYTPQFNHWESSSFSTIPTV